MTATALGKKRMLDVIAPHGALDLGLVLTHACNLSCHYCYTGEKKRVRMSLEIARRALDLGFEAIANRPGRALSSSDANSELQLTFFGGEPLLEADLLLSLATEARARAEAAGCRLLMQTTTNGTLLDHNLATRLTDLGVHLALSIDGTKAQHEAGRPLAGGGSSYDATMRALRIMACGDRVFDVISVVDPCNVHDLANGVRELLDQGVDSLTLNMNWAGGWDESHLATFETQLEEVAAIFIAWLRRGRYVRIQPLEGAILTAGSIASKCHAGTRRLAVAPSGRIYGCPRSVGEDTGFGAIGHLDHGFSLDHAAAAKKPREDSRHQPTHCACACAEETKNPMTPGPMLLHHDRVVDQIARRVSAVLRDDYELISVVERNPRVHQRHAR